MIYHVHKLLDHSKYILDYCSSCLYDDEVIFRIYKTFTLFFDEMYCIF